MTVNGLLAWDSSQANPDNLKNWYLIGNGVTYQSGGSDYPGSVYALAVLDPYVFVGGDFDKAGGNVAHGIARLNISTNSWSTMGDTLGGGTYGTEVKGLALDGNQLYVTGDFNATSGVSANAVANWNNGTGAWSALGTGLQNYSFSNALVAGQGYTVAVGLSAVWVGGAFQVAGGRPSFNMARFGAPITTVAPKLTLNPTSGPIGTEVTVTGTGFQGGEKVKLTFLDSVNGNVVLKTVTSDPTGAFSTTVTIPASAAAGARKIRAKGIISGALVTKTFTVTV